MHICISLTQTRQRTMKSNNTDTVCLMRNYMVQAAVYYRHFREIHIQTPYINYCPYLALCGVLYVSLSSKSAHKGGRFVPFTPSLTFVSLPQTQWHAPVNIDHMAKQTGRAVVCACVSVSVPMVVICKSCPLSQETVSGSVIKVTDIVLFQFPGNTDHSASQWSSLKKCSTSFIFSNDVYGWTLILLI